MRAHGLRATPSRLAVLRVLLRADLPISHTESLRRLGPIDSDPATIYRNLVKFAEVGIASVVQIGGTDRYVLASHAGAGHQHPHFLCDRCGQVRCIPSGVSLTIEADTPWAASIRDASLQLHGACPTCRGAAG